MRTLRWTLATCALWSLACALGTDTPPEVESPAEPTEPVAEVVEEAPPPAARPRRGKRAAPTEEAEAPAAEPSPTASAKSTSSGKSSAPPDGIRKLSSTKWSVTRSLVKKWEDQPRKFAKVNEKGKGWALKGVDTRDARHLGFQNGDVILSINGNPVDTQAQAVQTYGLVRNKKQWTVKFKRGSSKRTHTIQVVD